MNESEEKEEIKTFTLYPYLLHGKQALPNCKPISVGGPGDVRYRRRSHHPTTPRTIDYERTVYLIFQETYILDIC